MSKDSTNSDAELYIRLFPFIVRDFICKDDLRNTLLSFMPNGDSFDLMSIDNSSEALRKALLYKSYLDNGEENLSDIVKPIIEL